MKGAGTLLLALILSGFSTPAAFATTWPSQGTVASVQSIHDNQAQNGDTITLPAGTFTWANGVTIRKGITLQGVAGATQINRAPTYRDALITITGLPTDLPVRVTGIRLNQPIGQDVDRQAILINGPYGGTWGLTHVRFDHCYFYGGFRTILLRYRVNGVADHNTFHNCAYITQHFGDDDFAWNRVATPVFGTSDSFFFEDNSIIADSAITYFDTLSDQNTGGRLVWRHNTFDTTAFTGVMGSLIGEHGNQLYWQGHDDWQRGGISCEFYNNTVRFRNAFRIIWFRGGRNVVANNTFVGNIGTGKIIAFDEEEGITGVIPPTRTVWPAEDQVNNNFYFNNTLNGSPLGPSRIGPWQTGTSTFVQVDRDYWLQPPSPSTVTNYPHPTSPSLPNYPLPYNPAVTAWTPYVYPHPLNTSLNRATLGNISTRGLVQTGDNVMVGGFIIQGTEPKTVIMRAIGPSLTPFGIPNALADPTLELHDGTGALIASNHNWQTTHIGGIITANQVSAIQNSGYAPSQASESAIIATLPPGNYTAIVSGVNNTTGVALVDVYDLSPSASSLLGNISTRGFVQTGDNVMVGGFIIQGTEPKTVIMRAIGPSLTPFGIPNALADPTLELHDGTGALIASNHNWQTTHIGGIITANQVSAIQNSGYAPSQASESAIIATLPPGNYTAIVSGVNNTTGVALVDVYDLQ